MFVGLQKTSLVNFPGRVAAAVFLPGCNLRCPFCHNGELVRASVVTGPKPVQDGEETDRNAYIELDEVLAHLEKRSKVLGGLAISGGEPLLSSALPTLIHKAREQGLAVKIDTNGTLFERLRSILADPDLRPDMIAIDVKTSPERYGELAVEESAGHHLGSELLKTLDLLERETSEPEGRALRVEYRTVLVPGLVGESEIRRIATLLPRNADWKLAQFIPGTCLDPAWNERECYPPSQLDALVGLARSLIPGAELR
ncbi:MAG TPA: radical SAM protein [Treponemataceae bacterium]|nr:MAG: pyruvate formate lyase-activating enzyme 1 [Spirochaetes bacterium ADurb.Bin269]HOC29367.1 radical SAM protein [Treponemataceae bacterium]HQL32045.1 radical SAM protein [Treponemataceae bacterium]